MITAAVDGRMDNMMESAAFVRPDGKIALVIMNRTEDDMVFALNISSQKIKDKNTKMSYTSKVDADALDKTFFCPPRSVQTYVIEK